MNPVTKTLSLIFVLILGVFLAPAILIIFHDYIYAFIAITSFVACFVLFGYYCYTEFYPIFLKRHLEEEAIFHQFHGDKDKIRYYKGFRKHFDGELDLEQLEKWFEHHPHKDQ
jgi:hypothetical protein